MSQEEMVEEDYSRLVRTRDSGSSRQQFAVAASTTSQEQQNAEEQQLPPRSPPRSQHESSGATSMSVSSNYGGGTDIGSSSLVDKQTARRRNKKNPQAPKRFRSSYIIFAQERFRKIKDELADRGVTNMTTRDIVKMVGNDWRTLSAQDRNRYQELSEKDKARYEAEKSLYKGSWSVPIGQKRAQTISGGPKRPEAAFISFSKTRRALLRKQMPEASNGDISKVLGQMWKEAPEDVRKSYLESERRNFAKYKEAIDLQLDEQDKELRERQNEAIRLAEKQYEEKKNIFSEDAPRQCSSKASTSHYHRREGSNAARSVVDRVEGRSSTASTSSTLEGAAVKEQGEEEEKGLSLIRDIHQYWDESARNSGDSIILRRGDNVVVPLADALGEFRARTCSTQGAATSGSPANDFMPHLQTRSEGGLLPLLGSTSLPLPYRQNALEALTTAYSAQTHTDPPSALLRRQLLMSELLHSPPLLSAAPTNNLLMLGDSLVSTINRSSQRDIAALLAPSVPRPASSLYSLSEAAAVPGTLQLLSSTARAVSEARPAALRGQGGPESSAAEELLVTLSGRNHSSAGTTRGNC